MNKLIPALLVCFALTACSDEPKSQQKTDQELIKEMSVQQKLAMLDAGFEVPDTSLKVIRIGVLLKRLSVRYHEPVDSIAEWTSKCKGVIHGQGKDESCLNILEGINAAGPIKDVKFKEAIILYAMLKTQ